MRHSQTTQGHPALYGTLLVLALVMLVDQGSELAIGLYPYKPGEVPWRFAAFGLAMTRATPIMLADALLALAAMGWGSWVGVRVWAALHLLGVAALLPLSTIFGLDFLQLRRAVNPDANVAFTITGVRAGLVAASLVVVWLWAAIVGFRSTRQAGRSKRGSDGPLLVTGQEAREVVEAPVAAPPHG